MTSIADLHGPTRSADACDQCHNSKIRCDKRKPQCYECTKRGKQCNYGKKRKRGPKGPTKHKILNRLPDQKKEEQIQNNSNPDANLRAMLFELQFNKKLAELWRIMHDKAGEGVRPPPKFVPATDQFVRDPHAATKLMNSFDDTIRLIYVLPKFADSLDLATKIWNILLGVHVTDLLSTFNTFETPYLVLILEYLVVFLLGLNLHKYHDAAAYFAYIIRHTTDTVIYARDGTSDSLTPELTLQLLPSMTLMSSYYRRNKDVLAAHYNSYVSIYHRLMVSPIFNKELEARMICRRILCYKMTREERNKQKKRFQELNNEGVIGPSILYHFNHHLSVAGLRSAEDLPEGERAIQKAEYYINWHLDQLPPNKRPAIEGFYFTRLGISRIEISLRLGNFDIAQQRVGQVIFAFSRLPFEIKQMLVSYCQYFSNTHQLSMDYMAMLTNPEVTPVINNNMFVYCQTDTRQSDQESSPERDEIDVEEWLDLLESVEKSPQSETGVTVSDIQMMTPINMALEEDLFFDFSGIVNTA